MTRTLRFSAICVVFALMSLSSFAQNSPLVGTIIDVDEGRNRLQVEADSKPGSRITVDTDTVSTVYQGFGTVIAGKPEIFVGSKGLSNVRLGDRVEIRGNSTAEGFVSAQQVTLLGRAVAAQPVGVGQSRSPRTVDTPTTDSQIAGSSTAAVEGTIRQINLAEGLITVQTADRRILSVRVSRNTPVTYRDAAYRVSNLEVGDRIKIDIDPRNAQSDNIVARSITVSMSVQERGSTNAAVVTTVSGRVTRVATDLETIYVNDGRREIRVDMSQATDANREVIRASDVRAGDQIEISGSFSRSGDPFLASTVRFGPDTPTRGSDIGHTMDEERLSVVSMTGVITETLEDASTLGFLDRDNNRGERIFATESFAVRTKAGTYVRADTLREKDSVVIEAFRDASGNLIAQSIRLRNR